MYDLIVSKNKSVTQKNDNFSKKLTDPLIFLVSYGPDILLFALDQSAWRKHVRLCPKQVPKISLNLKFLTAAFQKEH